MENLEGLITSTHVVAAVLFILALGGLSSQPKAKRAFWYGIVGMSLAVVAAVFEAGSSALFITLLVAIGGLGGWYVARQVQMTQMPELMAGFHSLVGLAAVLIGLNADLELNLAKGGHRGWHSRHT